MTGETPLPTQPKQPIDKAYSIASIKAFQHHLEAPPTTTTSVIDPLHESNDSLVVMWMYSTISPKLVEMVVDNDTSDHGVWKRLNDLFHNNMEAHEKAPNFDELRSMMLLEESDMSHPSVSQSILHNTSSSPTVLVTSTRPTDKEVNRHEVPRMHWITFWIAHLKDLCASYFGKCIVLFVILNKEQISSMSDSEDSTVTYTEISSPYEDPSDPLPVAASPTTKSPGYILESDPEEDPEEDDEEDPEEDQADYPTDRGDDRDNEESSEDDDDDDDDDAEEEDHLAPADPAAVAFSADQYPYLAYRVTARMSIRPQAPTPFLSEKVAERFLALPTPPPSPLSRYSSPLPQIPSPPLPIPSPPPNSLTYIDGSLGSRAAGIRQRDALPSLIHDTEILEIVLPLGAARQHGPATAGADLYGFANMLDDAPGCQRSSELGYGITDTWDDLVGAIQEIAPTTLEGLDDALHDRALLRGRVNLLYRDRPFHRCTALLMEEEARASRTAWAQLMDACDQVCSEGISLQTTVMAQQSEIAVWRAVDRRRQTVISDLLAADHRRQRQLVKALKIVKSLKTQMIELQRQQGPAKGPAEPELIEEADSSS
ncbi:hypothetical protein Tco_0926618 [Tanacetum coccineum]|uniref:Uncharacterized protein n=1 Tax=Tanacetum coccineum TaxID=301880 RepID=A0ABQ5DB71_9ASTR